MWMVAVIYLPSMVVWWWWHGWLVLFDLCAFRASSVAGSQCTSCEWMSVLILVSRCRHSPASLSHHLPVHSPHFSFNWIRKNFVESQPTSSIWHWLARKDNQTTWVTHLDQSGRFFPFSVTLSFVESAIRFSPLPTSNNLILFYVLNNSNMCYIVTYSLR